MLPDIRSPIPARREGMARRRTKPHFLKERWDFLFEFSPKRIPHQTLLLLKRPLRYPIAVSVLLAIFALNSFGQVQQQRYRNKEHAFSISFPSGWETMKGATPNSVVKAVNTKGEDETIYVIVKTLRKGLETFTFENYTEKDLKDSAIFFIANFKNSYPDAILNDYGFTHLSNKRAIRKTVTYSFKNIYGTVNLRQLMVETWHKGKQYQIGCGSSPEKFSQFEDIFLAVLSSFILR
jgi:hypothetical protein